ncbi:MAG: RecQ family ATP-dependent DNA helicase [Acidithiobacillus sp.]|nr:RecQ family ATP-dependent DNA helicase [Acidithiobacillus sp.]
MNENKETRFAPQCLSIDLEVGKADEHIHQLAGIRGDTGKTVTYRNGPLNEALSRLDALSEGAAFTLGHNIIAFDLPYLRAANPNLQLLQLPVVDTLRLNPLAFPRNPYHHLVKHYQNGQLERGRLNDPELDARLTLTLFSDQREAFECLQKTNHRLLAAWHWLVTAQEERSGLNNFFTIIRSRTRPSLAELRNDLEWLLADCTCKTQAHSILMHPDKEGWPLAYALAWLSVADSNSVMPPWVRYQFPEASRMIRLLRDKPCSDPTCTWCQEHHNARKELKRWFGFDDFRPEPKGKDGRPLQQAIVEAAMAGQHVLGILPTGTGKSLCYQIPALSRYQKTGALTVVISPLVALMSDQVANLEQKGISSCATLNGQLSMPERSDVLDRVRLGDVGILITSPEQLRNQSVRKVLEQREIGAWVLDEAHCLSKWGHDFRPDYRYVGRYIRERAANEEIPPILCLTATAKPDVVADILRYFQANLQITLGVFNGGSERQNLDYQVVPTTEPEKFGHVYQILEQYLLQDVHSGGAIIYAATRKLTEELSEYLRLKGVSCAYFHAGMSPENKKQVQNQFVASELKVITATNAFGMGIDKPDVRLVIHADMPGSLENYLQEAGRAGRDQAPAVCVLMLSPQDIEKQFGMSAASRLTRQEIHAVLRALRRIDRKKQSQHEIVVTPGEILAEEDEGVFERNEVTDDTRVRTAISWLEEALLVSREENRISIFPSSLKVPSVEEARRKLDAHETPIEANYRRQLLEIVRALIAADPDQGISTDALMGATSLDNTGIRRAFADLERLGISSNDMVLTAFVHHGVVNSSKKRLEEACALEKTFLRLLQEDSESIAIGDQEPIHLRNMAQRLKNAGHSNVLSGTVWRIIKGIAGDGRDEEGGKGSWNARGLSSETAQITRLRSWSDLEMTVDIRQQGAAVLLNHLLKCIPAGQTGIDLLVETTMGQLLAALKNEMLSTRSTKPQKLLERALLWLHEMEIIRLNRGLTVFRPAMTIRLKPDKRGFVKADFEPLRIHYDEQVLQIHIMAEYAQRGLEAIHEALRLASDYFSLGQEAFLQRWLPHRDAELKRQTTPASWQQIVENLNNPHQQNIVADAREETNVLVLAGPGSGKTRVLVHRIAYLIRVRREAARSILALAYNHHAAVEIRQRLQNLIGDDARGVTILTCHAMAMRLAGISRMEWASDEAFDFEAVLKTATRLLENNDEDIETSDEPDALRDRLLAGYRWILVDEYQDIDPDQYALISALSGRTSSELDGKLNIFAVGDDDQNIYAFKGASVEFIQQFEKDYNAKPAYLVENYRSTRNIIEVANALISPARNRMKREHPICINAQRSQAPAGGEWEQRDPVVQGRVQILPAGKNKFTQAIQIMGELQRLSRIDPDWDWRRVAVIGRCWEDLEPIRAYCELHQIAVQWHRDDALPFWGLRETQAFVDWCYAQHQPFLKPAAWKKWISECPEGPYWNVLREALDDYALSVADSEQPIEAILDWLAEWGRHLRQRQNGLLLTTAHSAKGLEFDHVAVLDGNWGHQKSGEDPDVPRRLYYVAMTRAKKTLMLARQDLANPLLEYLPEMPALQRRNIDVPEENQPDLLLNYVTLSLRDVDLGFAGRKNAQDRIHAYIKALQPGNVLHIDLESRAIRDMAGHTVGKLAKAYQIPEGKKYLRASVAAILLRTKARTEENYRPSIQVDRWEVVMPELVFIKDDIDVSKN